MTSRLRVIHIMDHPPAYNEYANQARPEINWDTPDGSWVGIWGYDWVDLLAIEVRKINESIDHEIWQPDLQADKVYSKAIFPGVIHRLLPAEVKTHWMGKKKQKIVDSPRMISFIDHGNMDNIIFHIGQSVTNPINKSLLKYYKKVKFIFSFHGQIILPIVSLLKLQKNIFAKFKYLSEHFQNIELFRQISHLTFQSTVNIKYLNIYYKGPTSQLTMGIHFNKYQGFDKERCKGELRLPQDRKILITISRLSDLKQIDRLIEVLTNIENDFLFIVVGHGIREYEKYLINKSRILIEKKKILFVGYKTGAEKSKFLKASDLFIHVSKTEAGPVVNMEAMASGLPILTTNTGHTAEFLGENRAGCIVGIKDYKGWQIEIEKFLSGQNIRKVDLSIARAEYDWENIARKFNQIYCGL